MIGWFVSRAVVSIFTHIKTRGGGGGARARFFPLPLVELSCLSVFVLLDLLLF